jgi:hypothetical protein
MPLNIKGWLKLIDLLMTSNADNTYCDCLKDKFLATIRHANDVFMKFIGSPTTVGRLTSWFRELSNINCQVYLHTDHKMKIFPSKIIE